MEMDRRDFVKGLAAMFAVAATPKIVEGVGLAMTNQLTIIRWERVRVAYDFSEMFRMLGQFKYPPHLQPDADKVFFAAKFDDRILQDTPMLKTVVKEWQREFEKSVHDKYDTNCVFNYPSEFNYMDRVLKRRS